MENLYADMFKDRQISSSVVKEIDIDTPHFPDGICQYEQTIFLFLALVIYG